MMRNCSKASTEPITEITRARPMFWRIKGRVMRKKRPGPLAPSMAAASYTSSSIPWMAESSMSMLNPAIFQVIM